MPVAQNVTIRKKMSLNLKNIEKTTKSDISFQTTFTGHVRLVGFNKSKRPLF